MYTIALAGISGMKVLSKYRFYTVDYLQCGVCVYVCSGCGFSQSYHRALYPQYFVETQDQTW